VGVYMTKLCVQLQAALLASSNCPLTASECLSSVLGSFLKFEAEIELQTTRMAQDHQNDSRLFSSDAPIWNLADIPITDNGSEISAYTDSQSDIQLCSIFFTFQYIISQLYGQFSHKNVKF